MKIGFISHFLPSIIQGGVPRMVHSLANKLVERGHRVVVFSLYNKPIDAKYDVRIVKLPSFLQKLLKYKKALGSIFFPIYIAREDFSDFDIIHSHGDSQFLFIPTPIIRTFHGSALEEALYATSILRSLLMFFLYPFEFSSGLIANKSIASSKSSTRFFPFIKDIIYNGIDLGRFKASHEKSENPSILFVGRLDNRKRGRLLIKIFRNRIKKELPNAQLWLVCDRQIKGEGIQTFVNISDEELIRLYQKAHIFCLPSKYEGFGIPYVEAMACGTPVIVTPNPAAQEILGNGKYGILTNKNLLADELINLLKDQARQKILVIKGLRRAQDFSLDEMVSKYEKIYEELTGKRC